MRNAHEFDTFVRAHFDLGDAAGVAFVEGLGDGSSVGFGACGVTSAGGAMLGVCRISARILITVWAMDVMSAATARTTTQHCMVLPLCSMPSTIARNI